MQQINKHTKNRPNTTNKQTPTKKTSCVVWNGWIASRMGQVALGQQGFKGKDIEGCTKFNNIQVKNLRADDSIATILARIPPRVNIGPALDQKEDHGHIPVAAACGMNWQDTVDYRVDRLSIVQRKFDQA
jgi:hypothetical protein